MRRSADAGYADAQYMLGYWYARGELLEKDYDEAVRFYRLAADQGYARAFYRLGNHYRCGCGVDKDYAEALRLYQIAWDKGDADALEYMATCYKEGGFGIDADPEKAEEYRLLYEKHKS